LLPTVKKVKLRTTPGDSKIFREVNALSRLSHRFIVRYYTTWVETSEVPISTSASRNGSASASSAASDDEDGMTSVPQSNSHSFSFDFDGAEHGISIDLKDLDSLAGGGGSSKSSFPSIHFARSLSGSRITGSGSEESDESEGSSEDAELGGDNIVFEIDGVGPGSANGNDPDAAIASTARNLLEAPRPLPRTLYIQMVRCLCYLNQGTTFFFSYYRFLYRNSSRNKP
jgi:eukaryotic translation initiation factor 2-alpha kinase 4